MSEQQLLLGVVGNQRVDFDSLYLHPDLRLAVATIKRCIELGDFETLYISGIKGVAKSHILQAACHYATQQNHSALYLPLVELLDIPPADIFEQHQQVDYLFIDDVDVVVGQAQWQEALFHLFNERTAHNLSMFFSASQPALQLDFGLQDLKSRLSSCLSFQLPKLSDEQKMEVLQMRAQQIGMELPKTCAQYVIQHYSRDMHQLMDALSTLDVQSLQQAKKLTVPFIKQVLNADTV